MASHDSHVDIWVNVHDEQLDRDLKRIDDAFQRHMDKLDRQQKDIELDVDHDHLKKELQKVEKAVKAHEDRLEKATNERAKRRIDIQLKSARAEQRRLKNQIAGIEGAIKSRKREAGILDLTIKRQELIDKRNKEIEKAQERAHKRRMQELRQEIRFRERMERQRLREERERLRERERMERQRLREERERARELRREEIAALRREKELREVPKLEAAYNRLIDKLEKLAEAKRKARGDEKSVFMIELDERATLAEVERLRSEVKRRAGRDPIVMEVTPSFSERAGRRLRLELAKQSAIGFRAFSPVVAVLGADVGRRMGAAARDSFRQTMEQGIGTTVKDIGGRIGYRLARSGADVFGRIGKALKAIPSASVRLGPFTTSVRGAVMALTILSPVLLDVVGAFGSLVSVVGSATLGVGALAAGIAGGGLPALLGFGLVIAGVVQEFEAVRKAQKAYDDALAKGKTDLAKKKLQELQKVMGGVSEETARQFGSAQKLSKAWNKATSDARASVWTIIGESLETSSALMDDFSRNTNRGMSVAEKAVTRWLRAIRSDEGKATLNTLMENFNKALGPVLKGLGELVGYLAKVGAVASHELPSLAKTFKRWADDLNETADGSKAFQDRIRNVIQSAKDVGNFLLSAGRLMKAFFGAGVDEGQSFVRTMTAAMDRWTKFLNTTEGQRQLSEFFAESVKGAQSLYSAIQPLVTSFVRWSAQIAPIVRAFFDGVGAVMHFVNALLKLTGLRSSLTALATTLGVLWGIGKINAAVRAVQSFTAALLGLSRAQAAVAATGGVAAGIGGAAAGRMAGGAAAASTAASAAAGAAAARTAANMSKMAKSASIARVVLTGLGGAVTGIASPVAGLGVAAAGAAVGMYMWANRTKEWEKAAASAEKHAERFRVLVEQLGAGNMHLAGLTAQNSQAQSELNRLQRQAADEQRTLNQLRREGKKDTQEYKDLQAQHRDTTISLRSAQLNAVASQRQVNEQYKAEKQAIRDSVAEAQKHLEQRQREANDLKRFNVGEYYKRISQSAKEAGMSVEEYLDKNEGRLPYAKDRILQYHNALKQVQQAQRDVARASQMAVLQTMNLDRAMRSLAPVADSHARTFAQLQKLGGKKIVQKIGFQFEDPRQAASVARSAAKALRDGVPRSVALRIVTNAKDAEDAVRRLNRAKLTPKKLEIIERGGKDAVRVLEQIMGRELTPKEQRIAEKGGKNVLDRLRQIAREDLPTKTQEIKVRGEGVVRDVINFIRDLRIPDKIVEIVPRDLASPIISKFSGFKKIGERIVELVMRRRGGADGGMFAAGGYATNPDERKQERAARTAALSGVQKAFSQKVRGPRYLVGEEATPEFVISTNPAYRERNQKYALMAAKAVGLQVGEDGVIRAASGAAVIAAAKKRAKSNKSSPASKYGKSPFGSFSGSAFNPDAVIKRDKVFKPSKKKAAKFRSRRSWANYIEDLQTQQGYWEREVSIRESQVREPEEMVVRAPENDRWVTDPVTGENVLVEAYKPNPKIESEYKPDMQRVLDAMRTLMSIISELVRAIPHAIAANRQERSFRNAEIKNLNKEIEKEKNRAKRSKGKNKEKHQRRIETLREKRDSYEEINKELREDEKELTAARVEAGFDYREADIARANLQAEHDSASGEAVREADERTQSNMPSGTSGGGGGAGDGAEQGGISYGQQMQLADAAKADVFRQFGSNFNPNTGATPGGVGGPGAGRGQGMQQNLAGMVTSALSGAVTSAFGGSSVASAAARSVMSSGVQAAGVLSGVGSSGAAVGTTINEGDKQIIVNNTFAEVPPDPHTWAKGVEFEVASII